MPRSSQIASPRDSFAKKVERLRIPRKRQRELDSMVKESLEKDDEWRRIEQLCLPADVDNAIVEYLKARGIHVDLQDVNVQLNQPMVSFVSQLEHKRKSNHPAEPATEEEFDASAAR